MFCMLTCVISVNACNETNLMHNLSSVYSVTVPLHDSGLLVAHHQEVTMYIFNKWYVLYVLVDCQLAWLGWNWPHPICCITFYVNVFNSNSQSCIFTLHMHIFDRICWTCKPVYIPP
jgi:hypothetical protein